MKRRVSFSSRQTGSDEVLVTTTIRLSFDAFARLYKSVEEHDNDEFSAIFIGCDDAYEEMLNQCRDDYEEVVAALNDGYDEKAEWDADDKARRMDEYLAGMGRGGNCV